MCSSVELSRVRDRLRAVYDHFALSWKAFLTRFQLAQFLCGRSIESRKSRANVPSSLSSVFDRRASHCSCHFLINVLINAAYHMDKLVGAFLVRTFVGKKREGKEDVKFSERLPTGASASASARASRRKIPRRASHSPLQILHLAAPSWRIVRGSPATELRQEPRSWKMHTHMIQVQFNMTSLASLLIEMTESFSDHRFAETSPLSLMKKSAFQGKRRERGSRARVYVCRMCTESNRPHEMLRIESSDVSTLVHSEQGHGVLSQPKAPRRSEEPFAFGTLSIRR